MPCVGFTNYAGMPRVVCGDVWPRNVRQPRRVPPSVITLASGCAKVKEISHKKGKTVLPFLHSRKLTYSNSTQCLKLETDLVHTRCCRYIVCCSSYRACSRAHACGEISVIILLVKNLADIIRQVL